ncbi:hypothetical protein [Arcticibacter sp. MXS-1]|uniref:DUF922 domain-containing protein n=1 Tax=Arcticibacter sp. MXS-1 TaxID=3341726 RepID=UPI0035A99AFD
MIPRRLPTAVPVLQLLFFIVSISLAGITKAYSQVILTDSPIRVKPVEFYIAGVQDNRADKGPFAHLVISAGLNKTSPKNYDLQGGTLSAISGYLSRNLKANRSLRPAVLGIKELKLTESLSEYGSIEGRIKVNLSLGLKKDYGVQPLTSSQFTLSYRRATNSVTPVDTYLKAVLEKSLTYFNGWMNANVSSDRRLARNVRFSFTDYTESREGDTIYYSPLRKLKWDDFQWNNTQSSKYMALVMPFIAYDQEDRIDKGTICVNIAMKAYLPKSAAWARSTGRDDYSLNHEQRHFDIARIITERFKQKVLAENLTPDTYEAFLNMQYLDSLRDLNAMQKAYDQETAHGINTSAQAEWNEKIDKELKTIYLAAGK